MTENAPLCSEVERMTTDEVLALARVSRATMWRRIACGRLPRPIDRGRQALFLKQAVHAALAAENTTPQSHKLRTESRLDALRRRNRVSHSA